MLSVLTPCTLKIGLICRWSRNFADARHLVEHVDADAFHLLASADAGAFQQRPTRRRPRRSPRSPAPRGSMRPLLPVPSPGNETPVTRLPSRIRRSISAPVSTCRFGRDMAGLRKALAADQRQPASG